MSDVQPATAFVANVGAEESEGGALPPAARNVARLFALLFPAAAREIPIGAQTSAVAGWPRALGAPAPGAAFDWLEDSPAHAWLVTGKARDSLTDAGCPLASPTPEAVRRVHDKAFTRRQAALHRLEPACLQGLSAVLEPEELLDADALIASLRARLEAWPAWTEGRFALKPRISTSGRGRVAGDRAELDAPSLRNALPRLARRGGAVLEPWLTREQDLSAQFFVAPDGSIRLVSSFEQWVGRSGVYRGHLGTFDARTRITSGSRYEAALLESGMLLANAAHAEGFHGPCGVDAFSFQGPQGLEFHSCVEFNARFTMGTLAAGLLRRALPNLDEPFRPRPGEPRSFYFGLDAPRRGWPESDGERFRFVPLWISDGSPRPALLFAEDGAQLRAWLGD